MAYFPPSKPDIIIGMMGQTGTGKSSLVKLVTRDPHIKVSHGIISENPEIHVSNIGVSDGRSLTFIDTPGFDSSREGVTDTEILDRIGTFLNTQFKDAKKFTGIIYAHRITDPRMGGISARNLRMFKKLCGSESLRNVVIVTTRWDQVDMEEGNFREEQLMKSPKYFGPLVAAGARYLRHDNTPESARQIMLKLLDQDPITLHIQTELAAGVQIENTDAGQELVGGNSVRRI